MIDNNNNLTLKEHFLLTEYSALSSYFNQVINFRFVTFGFFITVVGFLFSNKTNADDNSFLGWIIIALTLIVWLLELRNRSLSSTLTRRGKEIELLIDDDIKQQIIKTMKNEDPPDDELKKLRFFHRIEKGEKFGGITRFFGQKIGNKELMEDRNDKTNDEEIDEAPYKLYLISHSFIFDISYLLTILFSFEYLIFR